MCGRYASARSADDLSAHFDVQEPADDLPPASWNVAPTDPVTIVAAPDGVRRLRAARWGLVPSWAKDTKGAARLINARSETVATAPSFRSAYRRRRCLVPADGYYEWQPLPAEPGVGGRRRKQAWFLSDRSGAPLAMAGLYELRPEGDDPDVWLCTTTVLTTAALDEHGAIHDRTPVLVPREHWDRWLDPALAEPGPDLLVPGVAGLLQAWPVGPEVGDVRRDGPGLAVRVDPVVPPAAAG